MKVPSLVKDDGQTLFDSPVICEYLDDMGTGRKLFPAAGPARWWAALRRQALGDGITDAVILCAYEEAFRPPDKRWSGWTEGQMRKAHPGLAVEGEDLSGPRTIGHITFGCMLGHLDVRFPNDGWRRRHPKLASWYEEFEKLPSMQATKPPPR